VVVANRVVLFSVSLVSVFGSFSSVTHDTAGTSSSWYIERGSLATRLTIPF
jgi:hypothetical protein